MEVVLMVIGHNVLFANEWDTLRIDFIPCMASQENLQIISVKSFLVNKWFILRVHNGNPSVCFSQSLPSRSWIVDSGSSDHIAGNPFVSDLSPTKIP
ncbi:hypothetical protein CR513_31479, partial [Mucuna pruriens]